MGDREGYLEMPLPLPQSLYGRTDVCSYADVITKFSRLDGLPILLTHGASLVRVARLSSAIIADFMNYWSNQSIYASVFNAMGLQESDLRIGVLIYRL